MIANDLSLISKNLKSWNKTMAYSPRILIILRFRGSSLLYPMFASMASGSVATEPLLRRFVCIV